MRSLDWYFKWALLVDVPLILLGGLIAGTEGIVLVGAANLIGFHQGRRA